MSAHSPSGWSQSTSGCGAPRPPGRATLRMTAFVKEDVLRDLPEAASEKRIRGRLYCSGGNRATIISHRLGIGDRRRGRADWNRGSRANLSTVRELELSRVVGLLRGERLRDASRTRVQRHPELGG